MEITRKNYSYTYDLIFNLVFDDENDSVNKELTAEDCEDLISNCNDLYNFLKNGSSGSNELLPVTRLNGQKQIKTLIGILKDNIDLLTYKPSYLDNHKLKACVKTVLGSS